MSTQASQDLSDGGAPLYRKPRADLFTVLLVIALLGLILGTTVLWMVMGAYDYSIKGAPAVSWYAPPVHPTVARLEVAQSPQQSPQSV